MSIILALGRLRYENEFEGSQNYIMGLRPALGTEKNTVSKIKKEKDIYLMKQFRLGGQMV